MAERQQRKAMAVPAKWSDMDPYLKAIHLQGRTVTATIQRLELLDMHPRPGVEETNMVCYFVGKEKALILNSTNKDFLRDTFGDTIQDCIGKVVTLSPTHKEIAGNMKDFILMGLPATKDQS